MIHEPTLLFVVRQGTTSFAQGKMFPLSVTVLRGDDPVPQLVSVSVVPLHTGRRVLVEVIQVCGFHPPGENDDLSDGLSAELPLQVSAPP